MKTSQDAATDIVTYLSHTSFHVAVAESLTGGGISAEISSIPGASSAFCGGVVAYHNGIKANILDIPEALLSSPGYGPVCESVALLMAINVRRLMNSQYSISATGIAGPSGGTTEIPVGTVYIAYASPALMVCNKFMFRGYRNSIQEQTINVSLNGFLEFVRTKFKAP